MIQCISVQNENLSKGTENIIHIFSAERLKLLNYGNTVSKKRQQLSTYPKPCHPHSN